MKYLNFIMITGLLSCHQHIKLESNLKTNKKIIYKVQENLTIDTANIKNRLIGYWFFDSLFLNKQFLDERNQYKKSGFSFERNEQLREFELITKGKKMTVIGNYKVEGDNIISNELNGLIKEYKVQELTDSSMVLIQNYKGNNFIFVLKKDLSEVLIDEKIYGKKK